MTLFPKPIIKRFNAITKEEVLNFKTESNRKKPVALKRTCPHCGKTKIRFMFTNHFDNCPWK